MSIKEPPMSLSLTETLSAPLKKRNDEEPSSNLFKNLGLSAPLLLAIEEQGYEAPTPIQEKSVPVFLEGHDLVAQAQTGTGKTAAFAWPILANLNLDNKKPQALVIVPTRELAIQVAEAFQSYAKHMKGFQVSPIYGGQDYGIQLRALKRGVHVIVGTPGRVMDHFNRKTIEVEALKTVILDEADEMLKMGFIDDIEWILTQLPKERQTGLFSATMPPSIQKIAERYLQNAKRIRIEKSDNAVEAIEQFYIEVDRNQKLDVLTRILEVEDIQAAIIFARTKNETSELEEKLQARGYAVAALNGDMNQNAREKVVGRLRAGTLDVVIATDVASRGIDVDRITHVINYDIPTDTESYTHRIGRTGRAGRQGKAILLVTPRERRLLKDIERATNGTIDKMQPPSIHAMAQKRIVELAQVTAGIIEKSKNLASFKEMVEMVVEQNGCSLLDVAAALAYLTQQAKPLPSHEIKPVERSSGGRENRGGGEFRRGGESRGRPRSGGADSRGKSRGDGESRFKPRGEGESRYKPRGAGDAPFKPRGEGESRYKPRGAGDAPFKPRGEGESRYKPRSAGDAPFKPRGEGESRYKPRGAGDAPFKPRGEGYKPRGDSSYKPRGAAGGFKSKGASGAGARKPRDR